MITGEESAPQALDIDYVNSKIREAQAATTILPSCLFDTRKYLKGLRSPQVMWHTLHARLNNTSTHIGRTAILRKFHATRPEKEIRIKTVSSILAHTVG
jgi:hypothetical protein